ncbi:UxaA family hydrolase [Gelria sp. Kuro-4]|uniref:UxaA family hydrolase n=1 Tax=Gelria sp. Kuro-4 TaxID=2796927 RepID=UPI001BEDC666|nr:UxaA family hydrolase [Gelria sp. Kuro-4]BCV24517.1 D-galactarate dehydratase [Gelria sp. Kuro-4]
MRAIVITAQDNVATALEDIPAGATVKLRVGSEEREVQVRAAIPFGHKFALQPIPAGGDIIKYGEVMGEAAAAIEPGEHVHVHNVESRRGRGDLAAKGGER